MKILFEQRGGISGQSLRLELDTEALSRQEAEVVESKIRQSGLAVGASFERGEAQKEAKTSRAQRVADRLRGMAHDSLPACDARTFVLKIDAGDGYCRYKFIEGSVPESVLALVGYLSNRARSSE